MQTVQQALVRLSVPLFECAAGIGLPPCFGIQIERAVLADSLQHGLQAAVETEAVSADSQTADGWTHGKSAQR